LPLWTKVKIVFDIYESFYTDSFRLLPTCSPTSNKINIGNIRFRPYTLVAINISQDVLKSPIDISPYVVNV